MRKNLSALYIGLGLAAVFAFAAETAGDLVFAKVRAGIVANLADFRGVSCMESVVRTRYASRRPDRKATCGELVAATVDSPRGAMEWRSRLRLQVTAGADAEEFAFTEASLFERNDVGGLLRAAVAGNGEFSVFLRNLMAGDGNPFQPRGLLQTPIGQLRAFGFTVPAEKSRFPSGPARAGYRGTLFAIPESGDLKRLTLEADDVGDACRVQYTTDYTSTRIGDREIVLPQSSTMEVVNRDGTELRTETYYSGCRRPSAPAVAAAGAGEPKPLPPNVRFRVRFQPPIDSETAATGDPVTGVIRTTVKDKQSGIVVHAGDRVHGRIALIEEYLAPDIRWNLAIAFQTIERGVGEHGIDQGVEQPVSLVAVGIGDRTRHEDAVGRGGVYFVPNVLLDPKFETEWETR